MRANQFITEVERMAPIPGGNFERERKSEQLPDDTIPLPGGMPNIAYSIIDGSYGFKTIKLWDTSKKSMIGQMILQPTAFPLKNSLKVGLIQLANNYKNMGLGRALYGIALSIMKVTLIAGDYQTIHGRRSWVSLNTIPGVTVKGWIKMSEQYTRNEDIIDEIMGKLGGQFIGKDSFGNYFFAFDVAENDRGTELAGYVKSELDKVYGRVSGVYTGLYATWDGQ